MFDEYDFDFDNGFEFEPNYQHVDRYLMDLLYPTPNPTLLPSFNPYKIETRNTNMLSNFFIFIGVLQFGMFLGFALTSVIYSYMVDTDFDKDVVEEIPYERKYKLRWKNTKDETNENIPSENTFVQELTPDGVVFMNYNKQDEGFAYWADNNIRFSYLETVARKFVNCFDCRQLYIQRECNKDFEDSESETDIGSDVETDNEDTTAEETEGSEVLESTEPESTEPACEDDQETETASTETITENGDTETTPESDDDGPFVKLKSYNKRTSVSKDGDDEQEVNTSCKFIKKGKLEDFKIIQDVDLDEPKQKITFASFKSMFMGNDAN
jgi:hypothetical protein